MKYIFFTLFLWCLSCSNPEKPTQAAASVAFADCKYGSPKPIFSKTTPLVTSHRFDLTDYAATETVFFDADIKLELTQSGCEKPKQQFKFTIPGNSKNYTAENWVDMALGQLDFMGNLEKTLEPLLFWSGALKQKKESIKLGQPVPLEQGHYVKIDKVSGPKDGILTIEMYQE